MALNEISPSRNKILHITFKKVSGSAAVAISTEKTRARQTEREVECQHDRKVAQARGAVSSFGMRDLGDERGSRNFSGSLLVAHPNMVDPNFRRTVLFVSEHEPNEGALGVIINRPLNRPVTELVSGTPP